jgi:hypothetical protein
MRLNTSQYESMRTIAACAVGLALMVPAMFRLVGGDDDFRAFYRAANLARARESVFAHPSFSPVTHADERYLPYNRIPSYAASLERLASLPYPVARGIWTAACVLAFFGCGRLFPARRDQFAIALAFSFPAALALVLGTDIAFVLLIALAAARIYSAEREFLAGLAASLLAIKFTYLPAAGVVFLAKSRRGSLGLAMGVAIQMAASFAPQGIGWPWDYLAVLRKSMVAFDARRMPNIRAVVTSLSLPGGICWIGAILLFVWLWRACRRLSLPEALIVALPLGLIASPFCFIYDAVVLIPLLASVASLSSWDGLLAGFLLTPIPWLLLMTGGSVALPMAGALVVGSTVAAAVRFLRLRQTGASCGFGLSRNVVMIQPDVRVY